jgi:hypothetical protein
MAMGILLMRGIKRLAIVPIGAMATYLRDRRHGAQPVSGRRGSAARDGLALERPRRRLCSSDPPRWTTRG